MHIFTILAVGSAQESWQTEAISQYLTRLRPFARVELVSLPDEPESPTVSRETLKQREAAALLKRIPRDAVVIALDETGKNLSSSDWAGFIQEEAERGIPLAFILGGANGLDASVRARAQRTLSFGKQTVPHMLARIMLLEQLYRAETILKGKTYHR